jgi:hypothetical protein
LAEGNEQTQMKLYALASRHCIGGRSQVSGPVRQPQYEWRIDPAFGTHATRVAAKLHWLIALKELTDPPYTDDFINSYFAPLQRQGLCKVVPVEDEHEQV